MNFLSKLPNGWRYWRLVRNRFRNGNHSKPRKRQLNAAHTSRPVHAVLDGDFLWLGLWTNEQRFCKNTADQAHCVTEYDSANFKDDRSNERDENDTHGETQCHDQ